MSETNDKPETIDETVPKHVTAARVVAAIAALIALATSGMLIAPYLVKAGFCMPGAGCDVVAKSAYGRVLGIPVAFLGAFAYSIALALVAAPGHLARKLAPAVALVAAGAALTFLYLQKFVIGAWCHLCIRVDLASLVFAAAIAWEWLATRKHTRPRRALFPIPVAVVGVLAISVPVFAATMRPPAPPIHTIDVPVGRDKDGHLVLREFVDLECPYCRAMHVTLRDKLKARPDIVVQRHMVPLPMHKYAHEAAVAACCAAEQGAEDRFVDAVVSEDVDPTAAFCRETAGKLGLDLAKYDACVASDRPQKRIDADVALLKSTGFKGLPTIDMEGERVLGALDDEHTAAFLDRHH